MDFEGCNNSILTINEDEIDGYQNYYYAHCPNGLTNLKQYNKVTYKNTYNNIDVSYFGDEQNGIKYDIIVQAHADPNQIKLHWRGATNYSPESSGCGCKEWIIPGRIYMTKDIGTIFALKVIP